MRLFGLIGYPLGHSFSQKYFKEKFEREAIKDCDFRNFELESIENFEDLLRKHPELSGLSVTIPHKETVIPFLHKLDETTSQIGAVNCIKFAGSELIGFNTDAYGFEMSIKPFLENKYERALILGTGGASKAVAHVLKKWNIPFHYATRNPTAQNHLRYEQITDENIRYFQLIVNTTPLGTYPKTEEAPLLPYTSLTENHFLYDLVYNPSETLFLRHGKNQGTQTMNGKKMLELQAERAWQIWNT